MAAAEAPASPDPTTMTENFLLFAGLMRAESILCFDHLDSIGPDGIFESGVVDFFALETFFFI